MTADTHDEHGVLPRPERKLSAIRHVLAANAPADVLAAYDQAIDEAVTAGVATGDIGPLQVALRRWWFIADDWRDPEQHRARTAEASAWVNGEAPIPRGVTGRELRERAGRATTCASAPCSR